MIPLFYNPGNNTSTPSHKDKGLRRIKKMSLFPPSAKIASLDAKYHPGMNYLFRFFSSFCFFFSLGFSLDFLRCSLLPLSFFPPPLMIFLLLLRIFYQTWICLIQGRAPASNLDRRPAGSTRALPAFRRALHRTPEPPGQLQVRNMQ